MLQCLRPCSRNRTHSQTLRFGLLRNVTSSQDRMCMRLTLSSQSMSMQGRPCMRLPPERRHSTQVGTMSMKRRPTQRMEHCNRNSTPPGTRTACPGTGGKLRPEPCLLGKTSSKRSRSPRLLQRKCCHRHTMSTAGRAQRRMFQKHRPSGLSRHCTGSGCL